MMARFGSVVLNHEFILEIAFKQMGRIKSERSLFHEETHREDCPVFELPSSVPYFETRINYLLN